MKTFSAGDYVEITGGSEPEYGWVTGKTQKFLGVDHYYVLILFGSCEGLLCHPDRLRLVEDEKA